MCIIKLYSYVTRSHYSKTRRVRNLTDRYRTTTYEKRTTETFIKFKNPYGTEYFSNLDVYGLKEVERPGHLRNRSYLSFPLILCLTVTD